MDLDASKYEVVSRCLQAASGAVPADIPDSLYLVHTLKNGDEITLKESRMEGSKAVDQDRISTDVKDKTPVAYLYNDFDERWAFCVDKNDTLVFYKYDRTWQKDQLGSLPEQKIHPSSKLCACFTSEGMVVYFQDTSGKFKGIEQQNGVWKTLSPLSAEPQDGTPLSISFSESDNNLLLYYIGIDRSLHYLTINPSNQEAQDHTYPESKFDEHIENFLVFRGDETSEAYFITPSKTRSSSVLTRIDGDGTRATLGYSTDGKFEPDTKAQCFAACYCPIVVYYVYVPRCCYCW